MGTATTRIQQSATNGTSSLDDAIEAAREAGTVASKNIGMAADRTEKMVKARPLAAIGLALGGGFILGAILTRAFSRTPSISEQLTDSLGLDDARASFKKRVARAVQNYL